MQIKAGRPWNWLLFAFSSIKADSNCFYAASASHGIYRIDAEDNWEKLAHGLSDTVAVNRLHLEKKMLYACTNEGLYLWDGEMWINEEMHISCYQYRVIGDISYVATEYGLWSHNGDMWERVACAGKRVYDFINLPQYLVVGHETGISLYDRFMDEWIEFELDAAITSLAVYQGHLIGTSVTGELFVGDKRGRFNQISFGKLNLFAIMPKGSDIYVCTDRGLFQLAYIRNQITLLSVKLGCSVTDVDVHEGELYIATLFQGIQKV